MRLGISLLLAFLAVCLRAQTPEGQAQGIEPRAGPSDYQAQAKTGSITIAAEFAGHAIPTPQGPLSTENYVVVETGMYGPPEMRLQYPLLTLRCASTERKRA